ncbi:MAG: DUF1320 domain-containing protein [Azonexus sp.]|jgi:phage gp36-like protein|nr:DUF1320 domain-containing protein [Azonexus sp.]
MYATAADLIARFDPEEIAQRADRSLPRRVTGAMLAVAATGGDLTVYTPEEQAAVAGVLARVEQAIEEAQSEVDGYVATRYQTPLKPVPLVIARLTCDLARYHLYDDQLTEVLEKRHNAALTVLRDIASGKLSLGTDASGDSAAPSAGGLVEVAGPERLFARRTQGGML